MSGKRQRPIRYAIGLATIALFMPSQSALAADPQKVTLQTVTQQFQQATAVVIASARDFFSKMNEVEQNGSLDDLAFERKPIDNQAIDNMQIISPQELKVRTDAMTAVSQYTLDLANLATGASFKTFGQNLQNLTKSLKQLGTDAGNLPSVPSTSVLKNKEFPGMITGVVTAIGAIVGLIEARKAQTEIKKAILANDAALTAITAGVGNEIGLAYERQRSTGSARTMQLTVEYNNSLKSPNPPNAFFLILLAHQIEASRSQMTALTNANPANAVAAMAKAHAAMVQYVSSGKTAADLDSLAGAVGSFFSTAQSSQPASATAK